MLGSVLLLLLLQAPAAAPPCPAAMLPLNRVDPVYPPEAARRRLQGLVKLELIVSREGEVTNVRALAGRPEFLQAASAAAKQWKFQPCRSSGRSVAAATLLRFSFALPGNTEQFPPPAAATGDLPAPVPGERVRLPREVAEAHRRLTVRPAYPRDAESLGLEGDVVLRILVGADGRVEKIETVSGNPMLVEAATDAVEQWLYWPFRMGGQPVLVETTITVNFRRH